MKRKPINIVIFIAAMLIVLSTLSGCSQLNTATNFTLRSGEQVHGTLIFPSGNVILEHGTRVTGSVVMLCCNLEADGEVDGRVLVLTGNVTIGPQAIVKSGVTVVSGDLAK